MDWKEKRLSWIDKLTKKHRWKCDDSHPFFEEVIELIPKSKAETEHEYLLEKEKHEKDIIDRANATRHKLRI
tara:strand:+ start:345 stop:560 length:216 start_codon:yes stop_codon:yes gene_type:complete